MYSVFESWMITEFHRQHLSEAGGSLADIFGIMTTLNGVLAIFAGIFALAITDIMRTQNAPFMAAVGCLALTYSYISHTIGSVLRCPIMNAANTPQNENFGDSATVETLGPISEKGGSGVQYIMKGGTNITTHDRH